MTMAVRRSATRPSCGKKKTPPVPEDGGELDLKYHTVAGFRGIGRDSGSPGAASSHVDKTGIGHMESPPGAC